MYSFFHEYQNHFKTNISKVEMAYLFLCNFHLTSLQRENGCSEAICKSLGEGGKKILGFKLKNFDHLCTSTDVATYDDNRDNQIKRKMVWVLKQNKKPVTNRMDLKIKTPTLHQHNEKQCNSAPWWHFFFYVAFIPKQA